MIVSECILNFDVENCCQMYFVVIVQDALMQRNVSAGAISKAERAYIRFKTNIVRAKNFKCALSMPVRSSCPILSFQASMITLFSTSELVCT